MTSSTKKLLLIVGLICLIPIVVLGAVVASTLYRVIFNPYLDYEVARNITLSSEWVEITPKEPLKADRQIQYVLINFAQSSAPDLKHMGLRLPDGSVVTPDVQLVSQGGEIFNLKAVAFDNAAMGFASENDLPKNRVYRSVRIRANQPIKLLSVHWRCWNSWDVS